MRGSLDLKPLPFVRCLQDYGSRFLRKSRNTAGDAQDIEHVGFNMAIRKPPRHRGRVDLLHHSDAPQLYVSRAFAWIGMAEVRFHELMLGTACRVRSGSGPFNILRTASGW